MTSRRITFADGKQSYIGAGQFRIEEYKLPEFKVTVQTPEENGRPKTFRLGEKVEALREVRDALRTPPDPITG